MLRVVESTRNGSVMQVVEALRSNPVLRAVESTRNGPVMQVVEALRSNPVLRASSRRATVR